MLCLDPSKNDTSVTLDLLRAAASLVVCVGHGLAFFFAELRPTTLPLMQNLGVLVFFLISGFLITHTLIQRSEDPQYGFWRFAVDRFARIYSGLIPALVLIVAIDALTIYLTGDGGEGKIAQLFNMRTLIASLLNMESYRGIGKLAASPFGSASPLWTLAIEWHIYFFVAAVFFIVTRPRFRLYLVPVALFFGQTAIHFLFLSLESSGIGQGLFSLWLGGSLVYFVSRRTHLPYPPAILLAMIGSAWFVSIVRPGEEYRLVAYPLLIAAFLGIIAASQGSHRLTWPPLVRSIRFLADYSFSLYLVHYTIMYAIWTLFPARGIAMFAVAVTTSNLVAIGLAEIGEKNHRRLADFIFSRCSLGVRRPSPAE